MVALVRKFPIFKLREIDAASKMAKRSRSSRWSHDETRVLAESKKEAMLSKDDGRVVWERIAQTISSRFPEQTRSAAQCRRRWETLVKVHNHIENYCIQTGQQCSELDAEELASMSLDTAYRQDWFDIVQEVCVQRKRKERSDDGDLVSEPPHSASSIPQPTKGSPPPPSTSKPITAARDSHRNQVTSGVFIVSRTSSCDVEKLSLVEEIERLKKNDALTFELAQAHGKGKAQLFHSP